LLGLNTAARAFAWSDLQLLLTTEYERRPGSSRVVGSLAELNMARGRTEQAKRFADELLAIGRSDAGAEVMSIQVRCAEEGISQGLFEQAREKLATGNISAFTFESLNRLIRDYVQGRCSALTSAQADALLDATTPNLRGPTGMLCMIGEIRAKFLVSERQWDEVPDALSSTISHCAAKSDALLQFVVGDWIRFALDAGEPEKVLAVMNALPRKQGLQIATTLDKSGFVPPVEAR
jgi:hypothetical protein